MSTRTASAVANMTISPEIESAFDAIKTKEVQDIIKQLAKFNLGVCVPHMHSSTFDFAALPEDVVQVEEDCKVSWVPRGALETSPGAISVAWRWHDDGIHAAAKCIAVCSPNLKKEGHKKTGHLPG